MDDHDFCSAAVTFRFDLKIKPLSNGYRQIFMSSCNHEQIATKTKFFLALAETEEQKSSRK